MVPLPRHCVPRPPLGQGTHGYLANRRRAGESTACPLGPARVRVCRRLAGDAKLSVAIVERRLAMVSDSDGLRRVTVIDDNQELVDLLVEVLDGQFMVVGCADSSIAAITATEPDVLFFDPWAADDGRGAWAFIDRVRNDDALSRTPIIVSSAAPMDDDRGLERSRGQRDVHFLAKPFALDELEGLIGRVASDLESDSRLPAGRGVV